MSSLPASAVLFDLDGTLVDSIELIVSSCHHAFCDRPGPSDDEILSTIGRPLVEMFEAYAASEADMRALIDRYREYQLVHHDRLTNAYPGIAEAVRELDESGYLLGIVTSKIKRLANRALDHVGLATHMRVVVGYDDTERHKPDPAPVVHALERLGATASGAVFVGDSPYDIEAGRRAGVIPLGVTWGPYARGVLVEAGAVAVVDHPTDLAGTVRRLAPGSG